MTYRGPVAILQNKTALTQWEGDRFLAQFDDLALPHTYTHGWTQFPREDFE